MADIRTSSMDPGVQIPVNNNRYSNNNGQVNPSYAASPKPGNGYSNGQRDSGYTLPQPQGNRPPGRPIQPPKQPPQQPPQQPNSGYQQRDDRSGQPYSNNNRNTAANGGRQYNREPSIEERNERNAVHQQQYNIPQPRSYNTSQQYNPTPRTGRL